MATCCAPFHTQLSSIMEVLVKAAVAEISVLVDEGYQLLHLEISRSQQENRVLKEKLHTMEMRNNAQGPAGISRNQQLSVKPAVHVNTESDRPSVAHDDHDFINLCSDGEQSYKEESDPVMVSSFILNELMEKERISPDPIRIKEERLDDGFDTMNRRGDEAIGGEERLTSAPDEDKRDVDGRAETRGRRTEDHHRDVGADRDRKATIPRPHLATLSEHSGRRQRRPGYTSSTNERPNDVPPRSSETGSEGSGCSSAADVSPAHAYLAAPTQQQQAFLPDASVIDRFCSFQPLDVKPEAAPLGPGSCDEEPQPRGDASPEEETVHEDNGVSRRGRRGGGGDYFGDPSEGCLLNSRVKTSGRGNAAQPRRTLLHHHHHQYTPDSEHRPQHMLSKREKRYVCRFCAKSFTCPKYLQSHLRVHTGEKPFSCSYCGKRFGQAGYLKKHQNVHTGEKPFGCLLCGKRFADSSNLIRHKSVHAGERPFVCVQCGERFASKHNLRIHQKRNHSGCSSHGVVLSPSVS